jgi:hypothetical protein
MAGDRDSDVALDLSRLLGFNRVAVAAENSGTLAGTLGAACNKLGGGETLPAPAIGLAGALGATYNKVGETNAVRFGESSRCHLQ